MKTLTKKMTLLVLLLTSILSLKIYPAAEDEDFRQKPIEAQFFNTPNALIYQAIQLLNETEGGNDAYEILRHLLKNDRTINAISRGKIQDAADSIRNYKHKMVFTSFFNIYRYEQRPYLKAKFLLTEALMDSRISLNESSDSEVMFVENLLNNYFYPGQSEKVTIIYPSLKDFAFENWALTEKNIILSKTGVAEEEIDPKTIKEVYANEKLLDGTGLELSNEDLITIAEGVIKFGIDFFTLKESYSNLKDRIVNRYLYQSMLLQAITEPGSIKLDPQLQIFLKSIRIKIDLGQIDSIPETEMQVLQEELGEDIFFNSSERTIIKISKLYGFNRKGSISNLELNLENHKSDDQKATLFLISSLAGEDLMFTRLLQGVAIGLKDGNKIANNAVIARGAKTISNIFNIFASLSKKIKGAAKETSDVGRAIQGIKNIIGDGVKIPSFIYDRISTLTKTEAGQKIIKTINNNQFIQSGKLMKFIVVASVIAELTTATIEYQGLRTRLDKLDNISETSARLLSIGHYLVPYVGGIAFLVDATHTIFNTRFESVDLYRKLGEFAENITLYSYGFSVTTLELANLEFSYNIPRHNVKLKLHGSNLQTHEQALHGQANLFAELENITLNQMLLIYRSHRELTRGANTDFGEKLHHYINQYRSNLKVYAQVSDQIDLRLSELEEIK